MRNQLKYLLTIPVIFHATASAQPDGWEVFELTEKNENIYIKKDIKPQTSTTYFETLINYNKPQKGVINNIPMTWKSRVELESVSCESRVRERWEIRFYSEINGSGYLVHKLNLLSLNNALNLRAKETYFPPYQYSNEEWNRRGFEKKFCKKAWEVWR